MIFALMPGRLLAELDIESDASNKAFAYSEKTQCLRLFQRLVDERDENTAYDVVYRYFLDIAGAAWRIYERWKSHGGFYGTRIRSVERLNGEIAEVPDGIIFPIIAALSAFVVQNRQGSWIYRTSKLFDEQELIDAAAQAYIEIAGHNPQTMGKNKACCSTLLRLTTIYARLG